MITKDCVRCGKAFDAQRRTAKYCSPTCGSRERTNVPKQRACRNCGSTFPVITRADANRQHCSQRCAKSHNAKAIADWKAARPGYMKPYNEARKAKRPGEAREKWRQDRIAAIQLLGGRCVVCGVENQWWLHIDYIETTRGKPFRHPRHIRYIREHLAEFRLLCANHHYELTLTGAIAGTDITQ